MPKEMKILLPITKIKESVKCKNTKQAYKIFRDLLDYEEYELKSQEHFRSAHRVGLWELTRWVTWCVFTSLLHVCVQSKEMGLPS